MTPVAITIPAAAGAPALHIHVNPLYALFHYVYVAKEALRPEGDRDPAAAPAVALMRRARWPYGLSGTWTDWERPVATADAVGEAVAGLREAMTVTIDQVEGALREAERVFLDTLWPQRLPAIEAGLATLREHLVPHFPAMMLRQGEELNLTWPVRIDAFLVTDCYAWQGGYSHPLTIDVARITGLELCETLIHEAIHVGDSYTRRTGGPGRAGERFVGALRERGVPLQTARDTWHAVIFASSAAQVKHFIAPDYRDYALTR